ncbi:hypothetical protein WR25_12200 [Diploscapter pachys]|uniref:FHA domain-containing protein n=1 Tax=Diploscapter pachys TaxID=2018661 RepID=A0A2A2LWR0_9BILA|nr:hypothetical protein WR25_12200 [Diploscapter pachys]
MLRRYSSHGLQTVLLSPNQRITIGSDPHANIHIQLLRLFVFNTLIYTGQEHDSKGVAPIHASIDLLPISGSFWLKDHSLTSLTKVNDSPICGQVELRTGDTIQIGDSQPFVFDSCNIIPTQNHPFNSYQGRLSIDRDTYDRANLSLPILGTQIRPNSSGFRAIRGRNVSHDPSRTHSRSSSKLTGTEEPRYTVSMPTNSVTPMNFVGSSLSDDSIEESKAVGLRRIPGPNRRRPPPGNHRIGDSLLQRVVRLQAELSERDREIFELRRLQNGHRSDGRLSADSLPYVNGSRPEENGGNVAFRLKAYRAFLGCLVSQLGAFNDRVLKNPQKDYADVFASFQRALDEPFQAKLFEIERRCEEEFEESGIEKDQLLKLKDILRVDKREKISQLSSELETVLPVVRDAASIARESIRLSRHWLPPSITPVLRLVALKLDGVEQPSRDFKPKRENEAQTHLMGREIDENLESAAKLASIIEQLENEKISLQEKLAEVRLPNSEDDRMKQTYEEDEDDEESMDDAIKRAELKVNQLQAQLEDLTFKIKTVTVFWDLDMRSSEKISQLLDRIFDVTKPVKKLINYQGKWSFATNKVIGKLVKSVSRSTIASNVSHEGDEVEIEEPMVKRAKPPMLQARPAAPIEDDFSSWIQESMDQDDDGEALEIAMGNKPLRNSESAEEKADEKSENRLKRSISNGSRGKQLQLNVSTIEEEEESGDVEHHSVEKDQTQLDSELHQGQDAVSLNDDYSELPVESKEMNESITEDQDRAPSRRFNMDEQNRSVVIEEDLLGLCEAVRRKIGKPIEVIKSDREKLISVPKVIIMDLIAGVTELLNKRDFWNDDDLNSPLINPSAAKRRQRPKSAKSRGGRTRPQLSTMKEDSGSIDLEEAMKTPKNDMEFAFPEIASPVHRSLKSPRSTGRSVSFDDSMVKIIKRRSTNSMIDLTDDMQRKNSDDKQESLEDPEDQYEAVIESEPYDLVHNQADLDQDERGSSEIEISEDVAYLAAKNLVNEAINSILREEAERIRKEAESFTTDEGSFDYENVSSVIPEMECASTEHDADDELGGQTSEVLTNERDEGHVSDDVGERGSERGPDSSERIEMPIISIEKELHETDAEEPSREVAPEGLNKNKVLIRVNSEDAPPTDRTERSSEMKTEDDHHGPQTVIQEVSPKDEIPEMKNGVKSVKIEGSQFLMLKSPLIVQKRSWKSWVILWRRTTRLRVWRTTLRSASPTVKWLRMLVGFTCKLNANLFDRQIPRRLTQRVGTIIWANGLTHLPLKRQIHLYSRKFKQKYKMKPHRINTMMTTPWIALI